MAKNAMLVYVGTFTGTAAKSKGIYYFRADRDPVSQNIGLTPLGLAAETPSPSFLALDSQRRLLFCANEMNSFEGKPGGGVSAFSIDPATGQLKLIDQQSSMGAGPCHLVLDKTGRNLLVANYGSGNVAVLPVAADGRLGEATCVVQDTGKGPNPGRQQGPHAHCVALSPDNRFAFVCDLGTDKVMIFQFDARHGKLTPNDPPFASVPPGAGARHIVFHPNGKFAHVINEMGSSVTVFAYDARAGALKELQTRSTLPEHYGEPSTGAEIAIEPSGRFLFASNRGHNTLSQFAVDPKNGTLDWIAELDSGGKTPRHFGIEPSGKYLAVCNQDSDTVQMCRIEPGNGRLKPMGELTHVPSPVCAVFLPMNPAEVGLTNGDGDNIPGRYKN
ncbi:MAG TPA: lactonase family protein [Verrucomicrobiae bacterium]|nr:lactonase family protein [Verrucomicrobiae bacterium]